MDCSVRNATEKRFRKSLVYKGWAYIGKRTNYTVVMQTNAKITER